MQRGQDTVLTPLRPTPLRIDARQRGMHEAGDEFGDHQRHKKCEGVRGGVNLSTQRLVQVLSEVLIDKFD